MPGNSSVSTGLFSGLTQPTQGSLGIGGGGGLLSGAGTGIGGLSGNNPAAGTSGGLFSGLGQGIGGGSSGGLFNNQNNNQNSGGLGGILGGGGGLGGMSGTSGGGILGGGLTGGGLGGGSFGGGLGANSSLGGSGGLFGGLMGGNQNPAGGFGQNANNNPIGGGGGSGGLFGGVGAGTGGGLGLQTNPGGGGLFGNSAGVFGQNNTNPMGVGFGGAAGAMYGNRLSGTTEFQFDENSCRNKEKMIVHSINFMNQYKDKSLEELRCEDMKLIKSGQLSDQLKSFINSKLNNQPTQGLGNLGSFGMTSGTGILGQNNLFGGMKTGQTTNPSPLGGGLGGLGMNNNSLLGGLGQQMKMGNGMPQTGGLLGNSNPPSTGGLFANATALGSASKPLGAGFPTLGQTSTGNTGGLFSGLTNAQPQNAGISPFGANTSTQQFQNQGGLFNLSKPETNYGAGGTTGLGTAGGGLLGLGSTTGSLLGTQAPNLLNTGAATPMLGSSLGMGLQAQPQNLLGNSGSYFSGNFGGSYLGGGQQTQAPFLGQSATSSGSLLGTYAGESPYMLAANHPQAFASGLSQNTQRAVVNPPENLTDQDTISLPYNPFKSNRVYQTPKGFDKRGTNHSKASRTSNASLLKNGTKSEFKGNFMNDSTRVYGASMTKGAVTEPPQQNQIKNDKEEKVSRDSKILGGKKIKLIINFTFPEDKTTTIHTITSITVDDLKENILKIIGMSSQKKSCRLLCRALNHNYIPVLLKESWNLEDCKLVDNDNIDLVIEENEDFYREENEEYQEEGLENEGDDQYEDDNILADESQIPVLTMAGYSTEPALITLSRMTETQLSRVKNFVICNKYARITFKGYTDVRSLNLDRIVRLNYKSVEIYPEEDFDDDRKPKAGTQLNKEAEIEFFDFEIPEGKKGKMDIETFEKKIKRWCSKSEMTFENYDSKKQTLKVSVKHF